MNERVTSTSTALELLVPPFDSVRDDWDDIVRRAIGNDASQSAAGTQSPPWGWFTRPRGLRRLRPLTVAAIVTTALALAGLAIAAGFGAFNGISAAEHPQGAADALDPALVARIKR